jgi:hypothetical protein
MIGYFERYMNTYINGSSDEDDHTSRRFKLMLVVVRNETFSFAFFSIIVSSCSHIRNDNIIHVM